MLFFLHFAYVLSKDVIVDGINHLYISKSVEVILRWNIYQGKLNRDFIINFY